MRRILVAVDGSPASREAGRTALEFAERLCLQVTFIHVLPERMSGREGGAPELAAFESACEQYAEELLKESCFIGENCSWSVTRQVVHGDPAKVICALAKEEGVELVIVGARARGPLARALLGSVSKGLICRCPKPVLVVPERSLSAERQRALEAAAFLR